MPTNQSSNSSNYSSSSELSGNEEIEEIDAILDTFQNSWLSQGRIFAMEEAHQAITTLLVEARLEGEYKILASIPDSAIVSLNRGQYNAYELRIEANKHLAELKAQLTPRRE